MNQEILQQISIHACFFSVLALLWRIRQVREDKTVLDYVLVIAMASLALAYFQKGWGRVEGNPANLIDVWRELSLLVVMSIRIAICGKDDNL